MTSPILIEYVTIDLIDVHQVKHRFVSVYRPPNLSDDLSMQLFNLINTCCQVPHPTIIAGDFNLPDINWTSLSARGSLLYDSFLEMFNQNALFQLVEGPTRKDNTLDLIMTNDDLSVINVSVIEPFSLSDHSSIEFKINLSPSPSPFEEDEVGGYQPCRTKNKTC